jgi:transcriptional regulator with XRE-family HTH domain
MLNDVDKAIGFNVRRLRQYGGFTQVDLGAACHDRLSAQQVSKYELGESQVSAGRLVEFANILSCSINEFFLGVPRHE